MPVDLTAADATYSDADLRGVALVRAEYHRIVELLGRIPNAVELGIFGAMWSEHCGYKNSRPLLRRFPTTGPRVLLGPGAENAGAIDAGAGMAVVFKIESHNHPSAVEPFQGAATGVGGILRDIFTMGARPIALLIRCVSGIRRMPTRAIFSMAWSVASVITAIALGCRLSAAKSTSTRPIRQTHWSTRCASASFRRIASCQRGPAALAIPFCPSGPAPDVTAFTARPLPLTDPNSTQRSAVQVGDPFLEKLLMEACLELRDTGWLVGLQDLGAAGLTSSTVEAAREGGCGLEIDVAEVARRETGMGAYEIMLSESQERMLVIAQKGHEADIQQVFTKWGLHSNIIGHVIEEPGCASKIRAWSWRIFPPRCLRTMSPPTRARGYPIPKSPNCGSSMPPRCQPLPISMRRGCRSWSARHRQPSPSVACL